MTTTEVEEQKQIIRPPLLRMQIGLSFFSFILIGANDGAIGVLIPSMRTHYNINNATIALLFLFATAGYLIASFNTGLLAEKLGYRRFLLLGVSVFLCAVLMISLMPPFSVLLFMLLPLGFGGAILDGGQNAYIAALPRNSALLNYLHAFYGIGALLGPIIASALLAIGFQWNSVYVVWIVWSLILLVGIGFTFRSQISPPNVNAENTNKAIAKRNVLLTALTTRVVWLAALFLFLYVGAEASLGSWSYSFLTEIRHGTPLLMGWVVSGYWMGLTLSRLTLAKVSQRIGEKRLIHYCIAGVIAGVLLDLACASRRGLGAWSLPDRFQPRPHFPHDDSIVVQARFAAHTDQRHRFSHQLRCNGCRALPLPGWKPRASFRIMVVASLCDHPYSRDALFVGFVTGSTR